MREDIVQVGTLPENRVAEALKELHALVLGECPRLLDEDSGGDARLALEIEAVLAASLSTPVVGSELASAVRGIADELVALNVPVGLQRLYDAADALSASPAPVVGKGWKLVPAELSDEQAMEAGWAIDRTDGTSAIVRAVHAALVGMAPSNPREGVRREEIARIIDHDAFWTPDEVASGIYEESIHATEGRRKRALEKADKILSLSSPIGGGDA